MGIQDRIKDIEEEMARTQKNKKTEYHLGLLRARLSKLRDEMGATKVTQKHDGFEVQKSGDARVTFIGFPSVGKSTLLTKLTGIESEAADYEFTTLSCIAGKMHSNGAIIQLLDLPGIISGAAQGRGKGRQVIAVGRTSDLILMVLEARRPGDKDILTKELQEMGIRLNKKRPDITLNVTDGGGVNISKTVELTKVSIESIKAILKGFKINNCQMVIREDVDVEEILDVISKRAVYIKCIYCYNKADEYTREQLNEIDLSDSIVISSRMDWNLDGLKDELYYKLNLKRIYTKKRGCKPELEVPVILKERATIEEMCKNIHKDFAASFKHALVWGLSAKHNPQKVGLNHELCDEDVVQININ